MSDAVPLTLMRCGWAHKGYRCQTCGQGRSRPHALSFWFPKGHELEGRLLCYQCAAIALAGMWRDGLVIAIEIGSVFEVGEILSKRLQHV